MKGVCEADRVFVQRILYEFHFEDEIWLTQWNSGACKQYATWKLIWMKGGLTEKDTIDTVRQMFSRETLQGCYNDYLDG